MAGCTLSRDRRHYSRRAWRKLRIAVFERDNYRCTVCGRFGQRLECDHMVPVQRGGTDAMDNLRTICRPCHMEMTRRAHRTHHVAGQKQWEDFLA